MPRTINENNATPKPTETVIFIQVKSKIACPDLHVGMLTGLYYYEQRYYDANKSTFLSVDPLAEKYAGISGYTYCVNNPIMFVEPDGRDIDPTEFTDKNHQKAFRKMMKTEEVKEFFSRYMGANSELSVGDKTYKFNQNGKGGDREKDVLFLHSQKINMEGRLGCCSSYIKNRATNVSGTGTQSNVIKGIWEVIDLRVGLTEDQALSTLGHEAFVHAEGDANRLSAIDMDIRKGNMTEREYIDRVGNVGNRVITDHSDLANDKVTRFKNAFNSLGRIDLYNDDVKKHERYKNKPGNK